MSPSPSYSDASGSWGCGMVCNGPICFEQNPSMSRRCFGGACCSSMGLQLQFLQLFGLATFPLTESCLCYYVAYLYQEGLAHGSTKSFLSSVRYCKSVMAGMIHLEHHYLGWSRCYVKLKLLMGANQSYPLPQQS